MCNRRSSCRTCLQVKALTPTRFVTPKRCPLLKRGPHGTTHKRRSTMASRMSLITREAMNCVHGAGLWRPVVRFALTQSSSKLSAVDNRRSGGQDDATGATCRIHTCSSLISVATARAFRKHVGGPLSVHHAQTDGSARSPIHDHCHAVCRHRLLTSGARQVKVQSAMPFGLISSILEFNRLSNALVDSRDVGSLSP